MKSLFFLYLLALGVFGWRIDIPYSFNASEHTTQQTNFIASMNTSSYLSLGIFIYETYKNSSYLDGYKTWLTFTSPEIPDYPIAMGDSIIPNGYRFGPCGFPNLISPPHEVNISLVQEVLNNSSQLLVDGIFTIELEETLISQFPALYQPVNVFFPYVPVSFGVWQFRTVEMDPPYENKDLEIELSTATRTNVSDLIEKVIFWTEDKCNWTHFEGYGGGIHMSIPLNNGSSHIVTVPAKDIWYIAFYSFRKLEIINIYFNVVDRPDNDPPSPAFIPSLNLSVIVLLILSLFVYSQ
jgi:hypothetical protein